MKFEIEEDCLPHKEWVKVRRRICNTGEFDHNLWDKLGDNQKFFINEIKLETRHENDN